MTFVRKSKFRHVFGTVAKRENCYEDLKATKQSLDSNILKVNDKYLGYIYEAGGGGAVSVFPVSQVGRQHADAPLIYGHQGKVTDLDFSPFNSSVLATSSEDCLVRVFTIPPSGVPAGGIGEATAELKGHARKPVEVEWNPSVSGILTSSSVDNTVKNWDVEKKVAAYTFDFADQIQSIQWAENGNLLATKCRDKKIRVFDVRANSVTNEIQSHAGVKAGRVLWSNQKNWLISTGFGRGSDRELLIWDLRDVTKPIVQLTIDQSSGQLLPFLDEGTQILYIGSRGEVSLKYYELTTEKPYCHFILNFSEGTPMRGLAMLPKINVNTAHAEVARFYRLTQKDTIEPVSFVVPRRSELFQDDLYPPVIDSSTPSRTANEWFSGVNKTQRLHVFLADGKSTYSDKPPTKEQVAIYSSSPSIPTSGTQSISVSTYSSGIVKPSSVRDSAPPAVQSFKPAVVQSSLGASTSSSLTLDEALNKIAQLEAQVAEQGQTIEELTEKLKSLGESS